MEKVVEELVRGIEWTKQLQVLIQNPCDNNIVSLSQQKELVDNIFGSLTEAISVMSSGSCEYSGDITHQTPVTIQVGSPSSGDRRSVDSGQSFTRVKDRKGGYRKRKSLNSWTKISSSVVDEFAWRKYGQKEILNTTFPRGYFRCTHKYDQGCKATKQVQKIQEEPIKYHITYSGSHTCTKALQRNVNAIIIDSYSQESKQFSIKSNNTSEIYHSASFPSSTIDENKELEVQSDYKSDDLSPLDLVSWPDLMPLVRSDFNEDFLPCVYSYSSPVVPHGVDMDLFSKDNDFGNCFQSY